jgi:hypothetical protein
MMTRAEFNILETKVKYGQYLPEQKSRYDLGKEILDEIKDIDVVVAAIKNRSEAIDIVIRYSIYADVHLKEAVSRKFLNETYVKNLLGMLESRKKHLEKKFEEI